jgi:hypothetical protein
VVHREAVCKTNTISSSEMAVSSSSRTGFQNLPGELRNHVYHIFFESVLAPTAPHRGIDFFTQPINHDNIQFAEAYLIEPITNLFLASRQISVEARTLYYAYYFTRRHYVLRSRQSIYSFSRVPSKWAQTLHHVHLTALDTTQARKLFNPVKVALVNAARTDQNTSSPRLRPYYLVLGGDVRDRKFRARLNLDGVPTKLSIRYSTNTLELHLVGPLGRMDYDPDDAVHEGERAGAIEGETGQAATEQHLRSDAPDARESSATTAVY